MSGFDTLGHSASCQISSSNISRDLVIAAFEVEAFLVGWLIAFLEFNFCRRPWPLWWQFVFLLTSWASDIIKEQNLECTIHATTVCSSWLDTKNLGSWSRITVVLERFEKQIELGSNCFLSLCILIWAIVKSLAFIFEYGTIRENWIWARGSRRTHQCGSQSKLHL